MIVPHATVQKHTHSLIIIFSRNSTCALLVQRPVPVRPLSFPSTIIILSSAAANLCGYVTDHSPAVLSFSREQMRP